MARHVLIVDDDADTCDVIGDILRSAGYEVTATASGFGVGTLVRELHPCAVLLDLGLPFRPGSSVLSDLKADPRTADVPVLVLSGMTEALSTERRALASAVLAKPIDMYELLNAVSAAAA